MPAESPQSMPKDMEELDYLIARAYSQGIETGKRNGRNDTLEALRNFFRKEFNLSKGHRRRANPEDPKSAAILTVWEKFNEKVEDGSLWQ